MIHRKFSNKHGRNNLLFFFAFFAFMLVLGLLVNLVPSGVWNKNLSVSGFTFPIYILFPVVLISFFLGFSLWIGKKKSFSHPSIYLMNEENEQFQNQYNQDRAIPLSSNQNFGLVILIFFLVVAGLVLLPSLLKFDLSEKAKNTWTYIVLGAAVIGYIAYLGRYAAKYNEYMMQVFNSINSRFRDTNIQLESAPSSTGDAPLKTLIKGKYKGYEFASDFYTFNPKAVQNYAASKATLGVGVMSSHSIEYTTSLKLNNPSKQNFSIQEKNEDWQKTEGNHLDEAFNQRFELKGISSGKLSDSLKMKLLKYQRNLNLEVRADKMTYTSKSLTILPYYGIEGLILFLDFMREIADEVEKMEQ